MKRDGSDYRTFTETAILLSRQSERITRTARTRKSGFADRASDIGNQYNH